MKKIFALLLIGSASLCSATEIEHLQVIDYTHGWHSTYGDFKYKQVWQCLLVNDFKYAMRYLDEIRPDGIEDTLHQDLIQLYVAIKMKDKELQRDMINEIEDMVDSVIDES